MYLRFNRPSLSGKEFEFMRQAVVDGKLSGDGQFTKKCHALLEKELGVSKALLTTSCTHALEMAAILLEIKQEDEVIIPSFTFVSVANAFALRGARPVFADIRADTLNLDETKLEKLITPRTKAIVAVHYAGVGCEMDTILEIAGRHGIPVVEDNAHGLFGKYKERYLGKMGCFASLSFHETKNFTCGEGGALLINDPSLVPRAEEIREKGTDRTRFFRGQVDKYTWVDVGSSYLPADLLAAMLLGQLEARERIQSLRKRIWDHYFENLSDWALAQDVRLPVVPSEADQAYHLFYLLLPSLAERQRLIEHLKAQGIHSAFHYQPLHLSEMGRRYGGREGDFPMTEHVAHCLGRLPFYNRLSDEDLDRVVTAVREFRVASYA